MDIMSATALVSTVVLLLLGVEIVVCLGMGTILLTYLTGAFSLENLGNTTFDSLNSFALLAMPLYILTGDLISDSGIARTLVQFSKSVIGWLRGGLVLTGLLASGFFAAISGSNSATTATIGKIMIPEMKKDGYPVSFSASTAASGGIVGIIIPPSIVFVIYGVTSGVPVGDLFIGGILPGSLLIVLMSVVGFIWSGKNAWGGRTPFSWKEMIKHFWEAKLAFGASFIVLGGIYGGIFTPTEAGAIAAVYCILVGVFVTKTIKVKEIPCIMNKSSSINGMVAPIIALAIVFSQILGYLNLPRAGVDALIGLSDNGIVLTLIILFILLLAGAVMETAPNVVILTPLLLPIANQIGFDPIHFGVVVVVALAIGFITPPIGLNLFVASSITGLPVMAIAAKTMPYLIALIIGLLIITFVPQLTLFFVPQ